MIRTSRKSFSTFIMLALLVSSLIVQVRPSIGSPGDVMNSIQSPGVGAPAQTKRGIGAGDLSYASRTGALSYGYKFLLPPGRLGVLPSLNLGYSSQGSLRGGVASGWGDLGIPMIQLDTSDGILDMESTTGLNGLNDLYNVDLPFTSSMSGGHRLVPVTEPVETGWDAYRAERGDRFIRYERHSVQGRWRARTLDGKTWYFGAGHDGENLSVDNDAPIALIVDSDDPTTARFSPHHQPLTRMVDAFGNTIRYFWEADMANSLQPYFPEALRLRSIRYTENYAANLGSHARVEFHYDDEEYCSSSPTAKELPIGANLSHRGFFPWYSGKKALSHVETWARDANNTNSTRVRRVQLTTENLCPDKGGALRQLTSIALTDPAVDASSASDIQPPVTFGYGVAERAFDTKKSFKLQSSGNSVSQGALSWGYINGYDGYGEPSLERTLLDFDGDGRLDLVETDSAGDCAFRWYKNDGSVANASKGGVSVDFPSEGLHWRDDKESPGFGEGCSLSARRTLWRNVAEGEISAGSYLQYRFLDMNQDGKPDLVTSIRYDATTITHNAALGFTVPGISSVFDENFPANLPPKGACSGVTPVDISSEIDNLCFGEATDCGCAVLDQASIPNSSKSVECGDFTYDTWGGASDLTSQGGSVWIAGNGSTWPLKRNGHYPWMVYYNEDITIDGATGRGSFGAGTRIWSPIPLDPASTESGVGSGNGRSFNSSAHAVMDITGDGIIDVITLGRLVTPTTVNGEAGRHWNVFAGIADEQSGDFMGFESTPYYWIIPDSADFGSTTGYPGGYQTATGTVDTRLMATESSLLDVNADGLPDLIRRKPNTSQGFEIALNTGRGFCVDSQGDVSGVTLPSEESIARTNYDNVILQPTGGPNSNEPWRPIGGEGRSFARLADVDGDGLPDYYDAGEGVNGIPLLPTFWTFVTMGAGAAFRQLGLPFDNHLPRDINVNVNDELGNLWWVESDFMDLDGDGLDDLATLQSKSTWDLATDDTAPGKPLRLLNSIDNGQGLVTTVDYHPYNDPIAESNTSTSAGMASHLWVVTSIHSESQIDSSYSPAPDSVVQIKYGDPVSNRDHRGRYGFRGFADIQTSRSHEETSSGGWAVTEQRYDYDVDWSGRAAETVVYVDGFPVSAGALVASISTSQRAPFTLFGGATTSFQIIAASNYNCSNANGVFLPEKLCISTSAQLSGQSAVTHKEIPSVSNTTGPPLVWGAIANENFLVSAQENGMKRREIDLGLYSGIDKYIMHTPEARIYQQEDGALKLVSRRTQTLDDTGSYVKNNGLVGTYEGSSTLWTDETIRYADTGLVRFYQDAEDFVTGAISKIEYSGLRIQPTSFVNERGDTSIQSVDVGTGNVVRALGPNAPQCTIHPIFAGKTGIYTQHDNLGRPTKVFRIGCEDGGMSLITMNTMQYVDYNANSQVPAYVISTSVIDGGTSSKTTTYADGAGRTLRTELDLGTSVPAAVTQSQYDAAGQLVRYQAPSPSTLPQDTLGYSDTTYAYDSLGRATGMRQGTGSSAAPVPVGSSWSAGIGSDVSYGFASGTTTKTTTEVVEDDGPSGQTKTHGDHFGRLTQVDELQDGDNDATTKYEYDGNDNLKRITDADNLKTEMEHDMAGRRTKVTRGQQEWTYAYDRNGNMVRETTPNDLGESADQLVSGLYTSSTAYDSQDRPTSRLLAPRTLSPGTLDDYDAREIGYNYDNCTYGIGKLCSVTSGANLTTSYTYDWPGWVTEETESIELPESVIDIGDAGQAPDFTLTRSSHFEYNSAGAVTEAWLPDGANQASATHLRYEYDAFTGAPEKLSRNVAGTWQEVAFVTRNPAQRVISQTTGCLTRDWNYDFLGRVKDTTVTGAGCTTQNGIVLSEIMDYFDSSEVAIQTMYRAGLPQRVFQYDYDPQHQLTSAFDDLDGYRVGFEYSPSGRLLEVKGISGTILGRDPMVYSHGDGTLTGAAPHAPVDLVGTAKNLHYDYDFSGNVVTRDETVDPLGAASATQWSFDYDGSDQQREVLLDNGTGGRELYYYDSGGQRYMAVTFAAATDSVPERVRVWMGGVEIWFAPDALSSAMEVDAEYAYLSLGALNIGRVKRQGTAITTEASFSNGLSHLMGAVDWDTGVVNASFVYGPYGEIVDSVGAEQDDHLRRFNGKESDQLSELSYYGFRYYDELSLSWTQADPLFTFVPDLAGANPREATLYAFSLNNPVRYMDPDGLWPGLPPGEDPCDSDPTNCGDIDDGDTDGGGTGAADTSEVDWDEWASDTYALSNAVQAGMGAFHPGGLVVIPGGRGRVYPKSPLTNKRVNILTGHLSVYGINFLARSELNAVFGSGSFKFNLEHISVSFGWSPGAAFTVGNMVTLNPKVWKRLDPQEKMKLLAHEIVHSVQYGKLGTISFLLRYRKEFGSSGNYQVPPSLHSTPIGKVDPVGRNRGWQFTLDQVAERVAEEF